MVRNYLFHPTVYINDTYKLSNEFGNPVIYMTFKKFSYYLCDARVTMKCNHAPLCEFFTAHTLNSKVNDWGA